MESIMSTEQIQILAAGAVENLTQTLSQYAAAAQGEFPVLREALKWYYVEAYERSQILMESEKFSFWATIGTILAAYLTLVQILRFRNLRKLKKKLRRLPR